MSQSQPMTILASHKEVEWYTPEEPYIKMVREVLGDIELDPASNEMANGWIKATSFYTEKEDGLKQEWKAQTVFLNPPYSKTAGKSNQAVWSQKMADEFRAGNFKEGILLVNTTNGYGWYEDLYRAYPVCLVRERIRFINEAGVQGGQAKRGQTFVYMGAEEDRFRAVFQRIGRCLKVGEG